MDIETKSAFLLMLQAQSAALSALADVLQLLNSYDLKEVEEFADRMRELEVEA